MLSRTTTKRRDGLRKKIVALLVLSISLFIIFTGCGGGGAEIQQSTQTLGQELTDLDKAYKDGLITEKEYDKTKKSLLKKYN
jgi:hypothetical protein